MRIRYSTRTLLIVFTAVSLLVGLFATRLHTARRQQAIFAELRTENFYPFYEYQVEGPRWINGRRHGSGTSFQAADPLADPQKILRDSWTIREYPPWRVFLGRQLGRDFVFDVVAVNRFQALSAEQLHRIAQLQNLKKLDIAIDHLEFTDEVRNALFTCTQIQELTLRLRGIPQAHFRLTGLGKLHKLQYLELHGLDLNETDAHEIAQLNDLVQLKLSLVSVTDDSFAPLGQLRNLQSLELVHGGTGKDLASDGVATLGQLHRLRELTLDRIISLNSTVLPHLAKLSNLELLSLARASLDGSQLDELQKLTKLKHLSLAETQLEDAELGQLAKLTQLESLNLGSTKIGDAGLAQLQPLTELRELELAFTKITDEAMTTISQFTKLNKISLYRTAITDAGVAQLAKLQDLGEVGLSECLQVTAAAVKQLKSKLPNCYNISYDE